MRRRRVRSSRWSKLPYLLVMVLVCALVVPSVPVNAQTAPGFQVRNGRLLDGYGNDFVMRGINHAHTWFDTELGALADIKATGANTARVVLSTGAQFKRTEASDLAQIVAECRRTRLVCVLEVHDTTGYPDAVDAITLEAAVDYWIEMAEVLRGHESFVLVTIGNEPFGSTQIDQWLPATISAVERMRQASFEHTLVINAPDWGQDTTFTMRDNASEILAADPHGNVLFDIHMFGIFDDAIKVRSYIESFVRAELPLIIGEFGPTHTSGDTDEAAIMHWAHLYGIGYMGWSWSGNVAPVADLNVVHNFAAGQRTPWGHLLIDDVQGIAQTSVEASIFAAPRALPRPLLATLPATAEGPANPASVQENELAVLVAHVQAEDSPRNGLQVSLRGAGFSGDGYLTGFDSFGDSVTMLVHVDAPGLYRLEFGYRAPFGDKIQQLIVNGQQLGPIDFPASSSFARTSHGEVALAAGQNRITVTSDWGWFDLDDLRILRTPIFERVDGID